jgi:hypothetical protein
MELPDVDERPELGSAHGDGNGGGAVGDVAVGGKQDGQHPIGGTRLWSIPSRPRSRHSRGVRRNRQLSDKLTFIVVRAGIGEGLPDCRAVQFIE